jgi:hypothetical protein
MRPLLRVRGLLSRTKALASDPPTVYASVLYQLLRWCPVPALVSEEHDSTRPFRLTMLPGT